jgi:hypothetical protein
MKVDVTSMLGEHVSVFVEGDLAAVLDTSKAHASRSFS